MFIYVYIYIYTHIKEKGILFWLYKWNSVNIGEINNDL